MNYAMVLWFTGLSGSGKTTIARRAADVLELSGKIVKIIDGDDVRSQMNRHLGFSPDDIAKNNRSIAELCLKYIDSSDFIFVPVVSPFESVRSVARDIIGAGFRLVYIKASIEEVIRRDVKGLYKKALSGQIKNFIGIDDSVPYEEPLAADLVINTEEEDVDSSVEKLVGYIKVDG